MPTQVSEPRTWLKFKYRNPAHVGIKRRCLTNTKVKPKKIGPRTCDTSGNLLRRS